MFVPVLVCCAPIVGCVGIVQLVACGSALGGALEYTTSHPTAARQYSTASQRACLQPISQPATCLPSQSVSRRRCHQLVQSPAQSSTAGQAIASRAKGQASSMPASARAVTTLAHDSCRARQLLLHHRWQPRVRSPVQASQASMDQSCEAKRPVDQPVDAGVTRPVGHCCVQQELQLCSDLCVQPLC